MPAVEASKETSEQHWTLSTQILATVVLSVLFFLLSNYVRSDFFDDAYISYRYASNLARGHGLVWNVGDRPVQGFTNMLHTLVAAALMSFGFQAETIGLFISTISAVILFFYLVRFAVLNQFSPAASVVMLCAAALNPEMAAQTGNGMETLTAAAIAAMLAYYAARIVIRGASRRNIFQYCLTALAAGLTRPDLLVLSAAPLLVLLFTASKDDSRSWFFILGIFVAAGLVILTLEYFYFGSFIPLPFYVKQGKFGINHTTVRAIQFLLIRMFPLAVMAPIVINWQDVQTRNQVLFLIFSAAAFLGYQCTVAVPVMGLSLRFLIPAIPSLALLGIFLVKLFENRAIPKHAFWSLLILTAFVPLTYAQFTKEDMASTDLSLYRRFAETLKSADPGPRTMAIGDAGVIPYITGWRTIDLNGHNDPVLAKHPEQEVAVVLKENPDLVIPGMDIGNYQHERLRQAIVARGYVIIGSMHTGGGPPVTLYARPDYAHSHAVTAIQAFIAEVNR